MPVIEMPARIQPFADAKRVCCRCDGPIEDNDFDRLPSGDLSHSSSFDCIWWTEQLTVYRCMRLAQENLPTELSRKFLKAAVVEFEVEKKLKDAMEGN